MKFTFANEISDAKGALVVGVEEGLKLTATAQTVDEATGGAVSKALNNGDFKGKADQVLEILAPANSDHSRIVLAGLGKAEQALDWQNLGGGIAATVLAKGDKEVTIALDADGEETAQVAFGFKLRSYSFDKYKSKDKPSDKVKVKKVDLVTHQEKEAKALYKDLEAVAEGVFLTRDLVSEPPNVLHPESYAKQVKELEKVGLEVEVLGEKEMEKLGMGALLGVGQGSVRESKLVVMKWNGAAKTKAPLAFVGKGVTFDTGGISLKPAAGMEEMKFDMGGSGVVVGVMRALAGRKAKVNAVGVIGLVENMPDGNAQRPGDIVTSMSGQTIEVLNTDAEGRLVLADALWYTQDKYKPQLIVDLATLTGAMIVALGEEHAGIFSNDDEISEKLTAAGLKTGDKVWRMPMNDNYDKLLKSDVADMKNIGGKGAGSITAAQFLQRFVNKTPWVHIDIAGTAWTSKDGKTTPKGATGYGVRLLNSFVAENYEG